MLLQKSKNSLKLVVEKDFTAVSAESAREQLISLFQDNPKKEIIVVFNESESIDNLGLKLLFGLYMECQKYNLQMSLVSKNVQVLETVRLCGWDQLFKVKEA